MINFDLKKASETTQIIRKEAAKDKEWGFDLPLDEFALAMSCLTPQTYGSRCANRLATILELLQSDDPDRGDKMSILSRHFEFKGSLITLTNPILNLVQIRPWQDISGYIIYAWDIRDTSNIILDHFFLSKKKMDLELQGKATSAHGTKIANAQNNHIELALRIETNSEIYDAWKKKYSIELNDLKNKLKKYLPLL